MPDAALSLQPTSPAANHGRRLESRVSTPATRSPAVKRSLTGAQTLFRGHISHLQQILKLNFRYAISRDSITITKMGNRKPARKGAASGVYLHKQVHATPQSEGAINTASLKSALLDCEHALDTKVSPKSIPATQQSLMEARTPPPLRPTRPKAGLWTSPSSPSLPKLRLLPTARSPAPSPAWPRRSRT